jgi:hypothetical protein
MSDPYGDDPESAESLRGLLPDSIKRALVTGLSAVMVTEEGIRSALGDMRLPKEALSSILQQAEKSRKEMLGAVLEDARGMLSNIDITRELRKALTGLKLEVKAEMRFVDDDDSSTTVETRVKRSSTRSKGKKPTSRRKKTR